MQSSSSQILLSLSVWASIFYLCCRRTTVVVHGFSGSISLKKKPSSFTWPPHSGYHGTPSDSSRSFFEGWYVRIVTPNLESSLALIFHVFDPYQEDSFRRGVGCQVLTPIGTIRKESKDTSQFVAASHRLDVRNYFPPSNNGPGATTVTRSYPDFFRLTKDGASGKIHGENNSKIIQTVEFDFTIQPEVGWGTSQRQYSVAGFLAAFPVLEPHYQVLLSRGRIPRGFIKITTQQLPPKQQNPTYSSSKTVAGTTIIYDLANAYIYIEKNWGKNFPSQWFWMQANTFVETNSKNQLSSASSTSKQFLDLCVTSTGGLRQLPFFNNEEEQVGLIALHWNDQFLPFPNVDWSIQWGKWIVRGTYGKYIVELEGTCSESGTPVNCPSENGMAEIALETFRGELRVRLFQQGTKGGEGGRIVLDATDAQACLEIGGLPWTKRVWVGQSAMKEPIKSISMNVDLEHKASDLLQLVSNFVDIPGL